MLNLEGFKNLQGLACKFTKCTNNQFYTSDTNQQQQQIVNNNFINYPVNFNNQQQQMVSTSLPSRYYSHLNFVDFKNFNTNINEEDMLAKNASGTANSGSSNDSGIGTSIFNSRLNFNNSSNNIQVKQEIIDDQYDRSFAQFNNSSIKKDPINSTIEDNGERFSKLQLSSPLPNPPTPFSGIDVMNTSLFDVDDGGVDSIAPTFTNIQNSGNMNDDILLLNNVNKVNDMEFVNNIKLEGLNDFDDDEDDEDEEDDDDESDEDEEDDDDDEDDEEEELDNEEISNADDLGHFVFDDLNGDNKQANFGDGRTIRQTNSAYGISQSNSINKMNSQPIVGSVGSSLTSFMRRNNITANSSSRKHAKMTNADVDVHTNLRSQNIQQHQQMQINQLNASNSNEIFSKLQFSPFLQPTYIDSTRILPNQNVQHLQVHQPNQSMNMLSTSLPTNTSSLDSMMVVLNNNQNNQNQQFHQQQNMYIHPFQQYQQQPQYMFQNNPINHPNLNKLLSSNTTNNLNLPNIHNSTDINFGSPVVSFGGNASTTSNAMLLETKPLKEKRKAVPRPKHGKINPNQIVIQKTPQKKRQQKNQDLLDENDGFDNQSDLDSFGDLEDPNSNEKYFIDSDSNSRGMAGQSSSLNSDSLFDLMMSTKNRDSYFWQYNIQSKGPKTKKVLTLRNKDPHLQRDFFDPVFQLQSLNSRANGTLNKLRKGDGNDVTPNAEKLYNLGNQIRDFIQKSYLMNSACFTPQQHQAISGTLSSTSLNQLGQTPNSGNGAGILSSSMENTTIINGVRVNLKREKNKIASRACRLKKKAMHEANKIKLSGLNEEHSKLILKTLAL